MIKNIAKKVLGGAMGSHFTMTLANIFMWHWEKYLVADLQSTNEFYSRYGRIFDYLLKMHYFVNYHRYIDDVFFT